MAVLCKPTVRVKGFGDDLLIILDQLVRCDEDPVAGQPEDLVITSINDSTHKPGSKHYSNQAVDVRSKTFENEDAKASFVNSLKLLLGGHFTVLYENPGTENQHFHIQVRKA